MLVGKTNIKPYFKNRSSGGDKGYENDHCYGKRKRWLGQASGWGRHLSRDLGDGGTQCEPYGSLGTANTNAPGRNWLVCLERREEEVAGAALREVGRGQFM